MFMILISWRPRADYLWTFVTEFMAVAGLFLALRLAAALFGVTGFGEYVVARRVFAVLASTLMLGLDISLTRSLARAGASGSSAPPGAYFVASAAKMARAGARMAAPATK